MKWLEWQIFLISSFFSFPLYFFHERFLFSLEDNFSYYCVHIKEEKKAWEFFFLFCSFHFLFFFLISYLLSYRIFFVHVLYVSRSFIPSLCHDVISFSVEITLCVRWIILMEMNEEWKQTREMMMEWFCQILKRKFMRCWLMMGISGRFFIILCAFGGLFVSKF